MNTRIYPFLAAASLLCSSCFSPAEGIGLDTDPDAVPVTFSISRIEQMSFDEPVTRADLTSLCSRITLAVFQEDNKVKNINQLSDNASFGTFSLALAPGTYQVVLIAHNGLGNCSVSSPENITFANNKCTDTFYSYSTIEIEEATTQSFDLKRAVAMFRLKTTDAIPDGVAKMKFYYTGGSSTFDAVTGFGCKNSRQTEIFNTTPMVGQTGLFEVYTFPHETSDQLKMTITALDDADETVAEREYPALPVTLNKITQSTVEFFAGSGSSAGELNVSIADDGQWLETVEI